MAQLALINCSNFTFTAFDIARWYGIPFFEGCKIYKPDTGDMPQYWAMPEKKKIVLVDWMKSSHINADYSWADLVISTTSEQVNNHFADTINNGITMFGNPNTIHLVNGIDFSAADVSSDRVFRSFHYFFCTVVGANDPVTYSKKMMTRRPYLFEALLGAKKSPRSYIYYRLRDARLLDKSLVNLTRHVGERLHELDFSPEILDPWNREIPSDYRSPDLDLVDNNENRNVHSSDWSTGSFKRTGATPWVAPRISELIPERVYQSAWFSLITETNLSNSKPNAFFITEKTVKALYGQRLFVFFGQQGHLRHLRNLGFKTFNGIIDESYDLEPDHLTRFNMAWEQVLFLAGRRGRAGIDPAEIHRRAWPILEHNFKLASDIKTLMTPAHNFIQHHINNL